MVEPSDGCAMMSLFLSVGLGLQIKMKTKKHRKLLGYLSVDVKAGSGFGRFGNGSMVPPCVDTVL